MPRKTKAQKVRYSKTKVIANARPIETPAERVVLAARKTESTTLDPEEHLIANATKRDLMKGGDTLHGINVLCKM